MGCGEYLWGAEVGRHVRLTQAPLFCNVRIKRWGMPPPARKLTVYTSPDWPAWHERNARSLASDLPTYLPKLCGFSSNPQKMDLNQRLSLFLSLHTFMTTSSSSPYTCTHAYLDKQIKTTLSGICQCRKKAKLGLRLHERLMEGGFLLLRV